MKKTFLVLSLLGSALSAALPGRAEWKEIGRLQVASQKVIMSQVQTLASQIKFPLLPMMVKESFAQTESARNIGAMDETMDWGGRIYADEGKTASAWFWPVSGGKDAWKKAHATAKSDECLFTGDGRYACVSEQDVLARKNAAQGFPFAKPLEKGFARLIIDGEEFFSGMKKATEAAIKEMEKTSGEKVELPEWNEKLVSSAGNLKRLAALLGMSKSGLDIRMRVTPKDAAGADGLFSVVKSMGKTVGSADKSAKTAFPELDKVKNATVIKVSDDPAQAAALGVPAGELWILAWRDGDDIRLIVRISLQELSKSLQSMIQLQTEEMTK